MKKKNQKRNFAIFISMQKNEPEKNNIYFIEFANASGNSLPPDSFVFARIHSTFHPAASDILIRFIRHFSPIYPTFFSDLSDIFL